MDEWSRACGAIWLKRPTEAYGFDGYAHVLNRSFGMKYHGDLSGTKSTLEWQTVVDKVCEAKKTVWADKKSA